ncbi:MAG: hypothetical protein ABTQ25_04855 [Nitrosomonas ureae]
MKPDGCLKRYSSKSGFSLAEIVVALFFVTMAITLVAGLGQQVMSLAKRSTQTGAILELRTMINSISRNSDSWIEKMRSSSAAQGLYAGCIPDPKLNIGTFNCPALDPDLLKNDEELAKVAGSGFHISSSPIVNNSGELIAGTTQNPVYLTTEGRLCSATDTSTCSLQSTGFFLRSNNKLNEDPGNVKFIIKVEKNPSHVATGTTPMKPQYMSVDIGQDWKSPELSIANACPQGTIKVGYLSNGKPSCLNPSDSCTGANSFPIGVDNSGKTICKSLPNCAADGGGVGLSANGNDLVCTSGSPCGPNNLFLGYFGGTGEPMCSGSEIKCPTGQLQVGVTITNGTMTAECSAPPPSCTDASQRLAYNGESFVCESAIIAYGCKENELMTGMNANGQPNCISRGLASDKLDCADGSYVAGLHPDGSVKCKTLARKCEVHQASSATMVACGFRSEVQCPANMVAISGGARVQNAALQSTYPVVVEGVVKGWGMTALNVGSCAINSYHSPGDIRTAVPPQLPYFNQAANLGLSGAATAVCCEI